jgi:hypothetical protein
MNNNILMVLMVVMLCSTMQAQKQDASEVVQYLPRLERASVDRRAGADVAESLTLEVSFANMPTAEACGIRCLSRSLLILSYGVAGGSGRYMHSRSLFSSEITLTIDGLTQGFPQWTFPTQPSLAIEGTATSTKPVATIVLDVTEYSDLACTSLSPTSNDIVITIDAIDTTGLTSEMVDSLVLTAELIQEYRILPYEGATLSCPSEIYVKSPTIADTTHPVRLTWQVADGTTPCPDLYPSFEVEVLRLYNTNPTYRDADTKTQSVVDWKQAQRFITYGPSTFIDFTLAEGTGYYVWRVRPIGNYYPGGIANEKNWGCWSNAPAQGTAISIVSLPDMDSKQDKEFGGNKLDYRSAPNDSRPQIWD